MVILYFFFFQAEDGIRDYKVTGVQTCALPISVRGAFSLVRIAASEWPRKNALRDFTPSFLKNCHQYHPTCHRLQGLHGRLPGLRHCLQYLRLRLPEGVRRPDDGRLHCPGPGMRADLRTGRGRNGAPEPACAGRSEEHTSELQSPCNLVCRLLLEKKKQQTR